VRAPTGVARRLGGDAISLRELKAAAVFRASQRYLPRAEK